MHIAPIGAFGQQVKKANTHTIKKQQKVAINTYIYNNLLYIKIF